MPDASSGNCPADTRVLMVVQWSGALTFRLSSDKEET